MNAIDISIVIVNYNVKDFLLQCLRSIERAKADLNVEVIVVDNDSKDGSVEFLEPLFPNVEFIALNENLGFGKANNLGIAKSKGQYTLILNPDTILEEDTLVFMKKYMDENEKVGISGCKVLNPDGTFQLACRRGFPTPWAAFCKLFGLQKLLPNSKLFASYNQTFRSVDETYYIDAVIGAFMFCRKEALDKVKSFDPDFFMYGEDLDLCYRVAKEGWKIAYVHGTSIIHYKGESTKRSSINEIKHFYEAMAIFAKKHFSHSAFFLMFLRLGILVRTSMAYTNRRKKELFLMIFDLLSINGFMLLASKIRFGKYIAFEDYAYPTVYIAVSLALFISMVAVGEYFEKKISVKKSFFAMMISFFFLSSLTYYFNNYAFSRGILLMTIGLTTVASAAIRGLLIIFEKYVGNESDKRIAIVGINEQSEKMIRALQSVDARNANIVGLISVDGAIENKTGLPSLGNIEYFSKIVEENKIHEVIITDTRIVGNELIKLIAESSGSSVRFHIAQEYEEVLAARIINEISGIEPTVPEYNITKLRFRLVKRLVDLILSIFLLTIGIPVVYLTVKNATIFIKKLWRVFIGKLSFVGTYPVEGIVPPVGKEGIIGLGHISSPERLSSEALKNLNRYYQRHQSLSLDIDIFLKYIFRKKSGN